MFRLRETEFIRFAKKDAIADADAVFASTSDNTLVLQHFDKSRGAESGLTDLVTLTFRSEGDDDEDGGDKRLRDGRTDSRSLSLSVE